MVVWHRDLVVNNDHIHCVEQRMQLTIEQGLSKRWITMPCMKRDAKRQNKRTLSLFTQYTLQIHQLKSMKKSKDCKNTHLQFSPTNQVFTTKVEQHFVGEMLSDLCSSPSHWRGNWQVLGTWSGRNQLQVGPFQLLRVLISTTVFNSMIGSMSILRALVIGGTVC